MYVCIFKLMCQQMHTLAYKMCVWNWYKCSLFLKLHYTIGCTNDDFNDSDSEDDSDSDDDDNDHDDYDEDDNNSKNDNILMTIIMTLVMMMIITGMVIIICY